MKPTLAALILVTAPLALPAPAQAWDGGVRPGPPHHFHHGYFHDGGCCFFGGFAAGVFDYTAAGEPPALDANAR
jgi:hypothetical protein